MTPHVAHLAAWAVIAVATAGVVLRPFGWPEAVWAVAGAVILLAAGIVPPGAALLAVRKGQDVYLFLAGMMLLSECARQQGVFDYAAEAAVRAARGSTRRLFLMLYMVGTVVTVFLSNDATAVVLTPAVYAVTRKAGVEPLPYLFICAMVANAASFVLPISNPANIVLYGGHVPALWPWLKSFTLPSILAVVSTYYLLRWRELHPAGAQCRRDVDGVHLSAGGKAALAGILATAVVLVAVSALDVPLGLPTAIMGTLTVLLVSATGRASPWKAVREVSWSVLPLVAGLFVLVEALDESGVVALLADELRRGAAQSAPITAGVAGVAIGVVSNLANNLPVGLVASSAIQQAQPGNTVVDALLIGVDLGPNLSITGSLATILWLAAIRREGEHVTFGRFLRTGAVVMPPALLLAILGRVVFAL